MTLISSLEIVQELVGTLRDFKIELPEEMVEGWRTMIIENAVLVVPTEKIDIVKDDPKDNKFFEAAVAGKALYIVSQDKKHVLKVGEYRGVKTIHPEEFVKLFATRGEPPTRDAAG